MAFSSEEGSQIYKKSASKKNWPPSPISSTKFYDSNNWYTLSYLFLVDFDTVSQGRHSNMVIRCWKGLLKILSWHIHGHKDKHKTFKHQADVEFLSTSWFIKLPYWSRNWREEKTKSVACPPFQTSPPRISQWRITPDQSRSSIFKKSPIILDIRGVGLYKEKGRALIGRVGAKIQSYRVLFMHIHFSYFMHIHFSYFMHIHFSYIVVLSIWYTGSYFNILL